MDHQSFAQLLGNYGEFVGAIAVVVTLAYLAVQVKHGKEATEANTKSLNLQAYQSWQAANMQINMGMSNLSQSEIVARGNADSSNLTFGWLSIQGLIQIHHVNFDTPWLFLLLS